MTLVVYGETVAGTVTGSMGTFTIQPVGDGLHAISQVDTSTLPPPGEPRSPPPAPEPSENGSPPVATGSPMASADAAADVSQILELVHDQVAPVADQLADLLSPPPPEQRRQFFDVVVVPPRQQSVQRIPKQPEHPECPGVEGADGHVPQLLDNAVVRALKPREAVGQVPHRTPGKAEDEQLTWRQPLPHQAGHADRRHLRLAGAGTRLHEKPGVGRRVADAFPLRFISGTHRASSHPETANDGYFGEVEQRFRGIWNTDSGEVECSSERSDVCRSVPSRPCRNGSLIILP